MSRCHLLGSFLVLLITMVKLQAAGSQEFQPSSQGINISLRSPKEKVDTSIFFTQSPVLSTITDVSDNDMESRQSQEKEKGVLQEPTPVTEGEEQGSSVATPKNESNWCACSDVEDRIHPRSHTHKMNLKEDNENDKGLKPRNENETHKETWQECPNLNPSILVQEGFRRAVSLGLPRCAQLWCTHVQGSEARQHLGGTYHVIQLGYIAEEDHQCLLNLTRMVVLHHSWPMCSSDFICATNNSVFGMSASDCMPVSCRTAETAVFVFMALVAIGIVLMSVVIMAVIILCPQFHKPKYYLRLSLAATDFIIGVVVCGHAAYNQWVSLTEVPWERFYQYSNLKANQLFRHVPNCLWGVSDVFTQISGFFVAANMIISLYTLSLMSLDRYLLLTRTHYRSLVTSRRVTAALFLSWCCGFLVPSLHFVYRPQKQYDICINYDTSSFDVHIINNESKIATADYKVYFKHAVPLGVTLVVLGLPVITLLVFPVRTLRKYKSYTRDHSVRQVKSALQLTQAHCSLSRQVSANSLSTMVNLNTTSLHCHNTKGKSHGHVSTPPAYKLKFTFKTNNKNNQQSFGYEPGTESTKKNSSSLVENLNGSAANVNDEISNEEGNNIDFSQIRSEDGNVGHRVGGSRRNLFKIFSKKHHSQSNQNSIRTLSLDGEPVMDSSLGTNSIVGGPPGRAESPSRESILGVLGLRRLMPSNTNTDHVAATIRRIRGGVTGGGERLSVRERDREITCTVLVNIVVFVFACFPLLGVGGWMMFLFFTQQNTINNQAPLKQLLFVAPWLMALNSLWNPILHLSYNHKFRSATRHLLFSHWRKLSRIFRRRQRYEE